MSDEHLGNLNTGSEPLSDLLHSGSIDCANLLLLQDFFIAESSSAMDPNNGTQVPLVSGDPMQVLLPGATVDYVHVFSPTSSANQIQVTSLETENDYEAQYPPTTTGTYQMNYPLEEYYQAPQSSMTNIYKSQLCIPATDIYEIQLTPESIMADQSQWMMQPKATQLLSACPRGSTSDATVSSSSLSSSSSGVIYHNQGVDLDDPNQGPVYVKKACINCKASHVACDVQRPCVRCVRLSKGATCVDAERKKRGRPSGSGKKYRCC